MKITPVILFLFLALLINGEYFDNREVSLPDYIQIVEYSAQQKFLGAANVSKLFIYNGHTGQLIQQIWMSNQSELSSFAFSPNNQMLAVGMYDGSVQLYEYDQSSNQFSRTQKSYKGDVESYVNEVCFTFDNQHLVFGVQDDLFGVWNFNTDEAIQQNFDTEYVFTVSCSPTDFLFAVAGGQNTLARLSVFNITSDDNITIEELHRKEESDNEIIFSSTFSADGQSVYAVGQNKIIYKYNVITFDVETTSVPSDNVLGKIRVSSNQSIMATVSGQQSNFTVFVINNTNSNAIEQFDSITLSLALSQNGVKLFVVKQNNKGVIKGECDISFYLANNQCLACDQACTICETSSSNCFECHTARYLNNTQCKDCVDGCLACKTGNSCDQCNTDGHFIPSVEKGCECDVKFFQTGPSCQNCIEGCLTCHDNSTCQSCDSESGFVLQNTTCVCSGGFFVKEDKCEKCVNGCWECDNDQTCQVCDSARHFVADGDLCTCDGAGHFVQNGTDCACQPGYYDEEDSCFKCPLGCSSCQSADVCTDCQSGLILKENHCVCSQDGQYIDVDEKCKNCNEVLDFCEECHSATDCTQCQAGIDRHLDSGTCKCNDGFYEDENKTCQACNQVGCIKCSSSESCDECDSDEHWRKVNNICKCLERYVQENNTCEACPKGCLECQEQTHDCLTCDSDWKADGKGGCQCKDGYYLKNEECLECITGCITCFDGQTCDNCDNQHNFVKNGTNCQCNVGFFLKDKQCLSCSSIWSCLECASEQTCTKCKQPFITVQGKCNCQDGKYVSENQCADCQQGCLKCSGAQQCTECKSDYSEDNGRCKKDGFDTLVLVLIIIGVVAVAGAVFALVSCIKKKRSPLEDNYEEID